MFKLPKQWKINKAVFSIWLAFVTLFTEWAKTQNVALISTVAYMFKVISQGIELSFIFNFLEFAGASLILHVSTRYIEEANICYQVLLEIYRLNPTKK